MLPFVLTDDSEIATVKINEEDCDESQMAEYSETVCPYLQS